MHDLTSEHAILGAILVQSDLMADVMPVLQPEDFQSTAHQLIYAACVEVIQAGETDRAIFIQVSEVLADADRLADAGGRVYINELVTAAPIPELVSWHVRQVKNNAVRRWVELFGAELQYNVQEGGMSGPECLEWAQGQLVDIAKGYEQNRVRSSQELKDAAIANMEARCRGEVVGCRTGFRALDALQEGLTPTDLVIVAARPGMGKSAFAANVAAEVAIRQEMPVVFCTLEMSDEQIMQRLLVGEAESLTIEKARAIDVPDHLHIVDMPRMTTLQLRAILMRYRQQHKQIGLVVVDYLQLMHGAGNSKAEEVSGIARDLKGIAKEYKVPVLALAQLNRGVESRQDKRPMLSDLKESGGIEENADEVLFLYRDDYYNSDTDKPGVCEVIVAKNRDGQVGVVDLYWRKQVTKFLNQQAGAF